METNTTTATILYPGDTYVAKGVQHPETGRSSKAWAERFKALGGEQCGVHPAWRFTGVPEGYVLVEFVGTPEALAWVEDGLLAAC